MMTHFIGNLACPIEFGNAIVIAGKTIDGANRLQINLRVSKEEICNIGLHLSVRFDEDIIVRNTRINENYGEEEREEHLDEKTERNPIVPGDFFIISIFAGETKFHISVNHRSYCTFKYRMPIDHLRTLEIRDHLQAVVQVDHRTIFPSPWPQIQSSDSSKLFSNDIPILFSPGHVIVIQAIPYHNPGGQFIIMFYAGDTKRECLHFNVRFEPHNIVVRNAMKSNLEFGHEERDGGFPFKYDQQFRLAIGFTEKSFVFAVNGKHFTSFGYRSSDLLDMLNGFKIKGIHGMYVQVSSVDHLQIGNADCDGFEAYSDPNYVIV